MDDNLVPVPLQGDATSGRGAKRPEAAASVYLDAFFTSVAATTARGHQAPAPTTQAAPAAAMSATPSADASLVMSDDELMAAVTMATTTCVA